MLFIQCHFLYLESLLQFHHLVCELQEQKQMESQEKDHISKKTNSDSIAAHLFIILIHMFKEVSIARYRGEDLCVDKAKICSRFYHMLSQKCFNVRLGVRTGYARYSDIYVRLICFACTGEKPVSVQVLVALMADCQLTGRDNSRPTCKPV